MQIRDIHSPPLAFEQGGGDLLSPIVKGMCFGEIIDKPRQNCWPKCFVLNAKPNNILL